MNRKLICALISLLFSYNSFSQIGNEIVSYVDSTEILVQKGRKMILKELSDSNFFKVKEVYQYLTEITENEPYSAFYYLEDLYINMLAGDWVTVNQLMLGFDKHKDKSIYPNSQELIRKLYESISNNMPAILADCERSQMDDQAKMLVRALLQYLEKESSPEKYNEKLAEYRKKYKDQKYKPFEKNFMPSKYIKASWNFSVGSGKIFPTGRLSNQFSSKASFNMAMDINIDNVFTSLYVHPVGMELQNPFTAITDVDTLNFDVNERFWFFNGGLKTGYFVVRNNRFHIAPYASISGSYLESTRYSEEEDNDLEYEIFNSFTYGAGLHTEVKVYGYEGNNIYGGTTKMHLSVKLETGYNKIVKVNDSAFKGDTPYLILALVWGFGQF